MSQAKRDENRVPTLLGVSNIDTETPTPVQVNPSTGAMLISLVSGGIPSGAIVMWSGLLSAIPSGWYLCDGTNGTPDLRNRFVVGAANGANPGTTGGVSSLSHSVTQPSSHIFTPSGSNSTPTFTGTSNQATSQNTTGITINTESAHTHTQSNTGNATTGITIGTSGAGSSHSHSITTPTGTESAHTHAITQTSNVRGTSSGVVDTATPTGAGSAHSHSITTPTGTESLHTHAAGSITEPNAGAGHNHSNPTTSAGSAHTHSITEPNAGAGHSHVLTPGGTVSISTFTGNQATLTHSGTDVGAHADTRPPFFALAFIMKA